MNSTRKIRAATLAIGAVAFHRFVVRHPIETRRQLDVAV